jgi:hypothetical protein
MGLRLKGKPLKMLCAAYDILRKDETDMVWIEAVHDLEVAKSRVKELAAHSHGEYVIFDQRARKIVANSSSPRPHI